MKGAYVDVKWGHVCGNRAANAELDHDAGYSSHFRNSYGVKKRMLASMWSYSLSLHKPLEMH